MQASLPLSTRPSSRLSLSLALSLFLMPPFDLPFPLLLQTGLRPERVPTRRWRRSTGDWTATGARLPKRPTPTRRRVTRWTIPMRRKLQRWRWHQWLASTLSFDQPIACLRAGSTACHASLRAFSCRQRSELFRLLCRCLSWLGFHSSFFWVARRMGRHHDLLSCLTSRSGGLTKFRAD